MKFKLVVIAVLAVFAGIVFWTDGSQTGTPDRPDTGSSGDFSKLVGEPAPGFMLHDYEGRAVDLSGMRGKIAVLFFNEGIMCYPACWNQIAALGTDKALNNDRVITVSIVADSADEWTAAVRKMPELKSETILLDTDAKVSRSYGMLTLASSMHKGVKPGHTYVIVDEAGTVRFTYDDPRMGIGNDMLAREIRKIQ